MKGDNIADRLLWFAAAVVRLCRTMPKDSASGHIMRQLVRSSTGGGSNYEEARCAESRADFIHKVSIATKELREAMYWLRLAEAARITEQPLDELTREANELVAILTSSIKTAKRRAAS